MIRVEIPMLPPPSLSPNDRVHWRLKAAAVKSFRAAAMVYALGATEFKRPCWPKAKVSITLVAADRRYIRDTDNTIASLKSAIDGCVDAGIVVDDKDLTYGKPRWEVDKERAPLVILEFEEVRA